jgi:pyruvyl transferase EpsO
LNDNILTFEEKNNELKSIIQKSITPFITGDCCLLGLPYYHTNIGDYLIWHGVELLLKELKIKCTYRSPVFRYEKKHITKKSIILLNGGGDFGDTWEEVQIFRCKIIKEFPNNKIIILPQTVFYSDKNKLLSDADLFNNHKNLILCARDNRSFGILKQYFSSNTILLVPDMAFFIPYNYLKKINKNIVNTDRQLCILRNDKELNKNIYSSEYFINNTYKDNLDISDWITIDNLKFSYLEKLVYQKNKNIKNEKINNLIIDLYSRHYFKAKIIKAGTQQLSKYNKVLATRLHAAILCCLLRKPFILFDNSYGKNYEFYKTWFNNLNGADFYS